MSAQHSTAPRPTSSNATTWRHFLLLPGLLFFAVNLIWNRATTDQYLLFRLGELNATARSGQGRAAAWSQKLDFCATLPVVAVAGTCGALSDRYGRRPLLLVTAAGSLVLSSTVAVVAVLDLPLEVLLPAYLVASFSGGAVVFFSATFSAMADLSQGQQQRQGQRQGGTGRGVGRFLSRSALFGVTEAMIYGGNVAGPLASGAFLGAKVTPSHSSFAHSFIACAAVSLVALVCIALAPESLKVPERPRRGEETSSKARRPINWRYANTLGAVVAVLVLPGSHERRRRLVRRVRQQLRRRRKHGGVEEGEEGKEDRHGDGDRHEDEDTDEDGDRSEEGHGEERGEVENNAGGVGGDSNGGCGRQCRLVVAESPGVLVLLTMVLLSLSYFGFLVIGTLYVKAPPYRMNGEEVGYFLGALGAVRLFGAMVLLPMITMLGARCDEKKSRGSTKVDTTFATLATAERPGDAEDGSAGSGKYSLRCCCRERRWGGGLLRGLGGEGGAMSQPLNHGWDAQLSIPLDPSDLSVDSIASMKEGGYRREGGRIAEGGAEEVEAMGKAIGEEERGLRTDLVLVLLGSLCSAIGYGVCTLAHTTPTFVVGTMLSGLGIIATPALRSLLSKLADDTQTATVLSAVAGVESLVRLIYVWHACGMYARITVPWYDLAYAVVVPWYLWLRIRMHCGSNRPCKASIASDSLTRFVLLRRFVLFPFPSHHRPSFSPLLFPWC